MKKVAQSFIWLTPGFGLAEVVSDNKENVTRISSPGSSGSGAAGGSSMATSARCFWAISRTMAEAQAAAVGLVAQHAVGKRSNTPVALGGGDAGPGVLDFEQGAHAVPATPHGDAPAAPACSAGRCRQRLLSSSASRMAFAADEDRVAGLLEAQVGLRGPGPAAAIAWSAGRPRRLMSVSARTGRVGVLGARQQRRSSCVDQARGALRTHDELAAGWTRIFVGGCSRWASSAWVRSPASGVFELVRPRRP